MISQLITITGALELSA